MPETAPPSPYKKNFEVTQMTDGSAWVLTCDGFGYEVGHLGSGDIIRVPLGFVTDFASVPAVFRWRLGRTGLHSRAAVCHDWLYWTQTRSRREADRIFREAMQVHHVRWLDRWAMWAAVRSPFGALAWRGNAAKRAAGNTVKILSAAAVEHVATEGTLPA